MTTMKVIVAVALLSWPSESKPRSQSALQTFTLEELVPLRAEFYPERLSVEWISDTEYMFTDPGAGLRKYNAATDTVSTILSTATLLALSNYSVISFSKDGKYILLASNRRKVYRHSTIAEYSVYDLEKQSITRLAPGSLQVVEWGGDHSLAYVQDNNVYYVPDAASPTTVTTLTSEGVPDQVYFGVTDWIYEEEVFNAAEGLWFSPAGTYLAIASFNDTQVESAFYPYYGDPSNLNNQYPHMVEFKYPKAGRANPIVGLRVYNVNDTTSDAWNIPAPVDVVGIDHILGRVNWISEHNLIVLWLNRRQSVSVLVNCNLAQDKCSIVKHDTEPNGWIDIEEPLFDADGKKMIELRPQYYGDQRFKHAASFDFTTLAVEDLTPVNSTVMSVVGWDSNSKTLYYILSPESLPWKRQLWSSRNGELTCISCKEPSCHETSAMFSKDASFGVISCSAPNVPHKTFLYNCQTNDLKLLKDNRRLKDKLSRYKLPLALFNVISIADGVYAHIKLQLPPDMTQKKYPMVVRVYAGPGTARVLDNYNLEAYDLYLAGNRSFILASIDVRGSGAMGVEALHAVNNALGTVEVSDTLAAIRSLVKLYSFIDPERIGVWGWSYGGFATTMMLIQDEEKTIACGAAVAPVTSWLYYDSIYTERYMDLPQENPEGYLRSDLMAAAGKLRGRRYLLVHGTGDDNVHYQNSLQLAKELQHADIDFEQMSYTDENHSLLGVSRHFYHTLDRFWTKCFYP